MSLSSAYLKCVQTANYFCFKEKHNWPRKMQALAKAKGKGKGGPDSGLTAKVQAQASCLHRPLFSIVSK